ncbi:Cof-type HAD-IIB family hydrolase [Clostridium sp. Marseille-P2415]|uniref:Cof-type HAD-IIB family hydrolase n=1 Tax=Clostridium sp. Marseille-P2415 TaxID=1805471 RepID=UPI00098868C3|nr:Cof-type HAD-IIB family hydrolase [Clostridium sp. Marseille-P2415]
MIRLVASDMDGTLLNRCGKISHLNIAAIEALKRKNIDFVVCTGRSFADASAPLKEAGISCDIICMNGAAVFDSSGSRLRKQPLLNSQVKRILSICRPFSVLYDFMTEDGSYTTSSLEDFRKSFEDKIFLPMVSEEHTFETIAERFHFTSEEALLGSSPDIYKMSVVHENPEVLKQLRFLLEKEEGLSVASSASSNLELTHMRAQKGSALLEYAVNAKIRPREILAIGDSENDLSMLGLPLGYTIAMGNASEVIKRSARLITRSNDEDGVAVAIEALILSDAAAAN